MPERPDHNKAHPLPPEPGATVSLLLAGGLLTLPFLLANPQPPVVTFQAEWLAVALGIAATFALLLSSRLANSGMPAPAIGLMVFALFLVIQAARGSIPYLQAPMLGVLYVLYAAVLIWLGLQLKTTLGLERTAGVLAAFLLAGALTNAAAGVIQYYGRPEMLEDWVARMPLNRATGNVGQTNLYANYLALGQAALIFLWQGRQIRTACAVPAMLLLASATALSSSRSSLIFLAWFVAAGLLAARLHGSAATRRLRLAACTVAVAGLVAHAVVPAINTMILSVPAGDGAIQRLLPLSDAPRWQVALMAARLFLDSPIMGVGIGQFASAAFTAELAPALVGWIWSSPHNLALHLLAETGLAGATLVLGSLIIWWSQVLRHYCAAPSAALWWVIAVIGVEMLDSMLLFPLWYAQFLGVTALLMGLGVPHAMRSAFARGGKPIVAVLCLALTCALGLMLRDYLRLDAARVTGTTLTLAAEDEKAQAAATMRDLTQGPLAPIADGWLLMGAALDRNELDEKLRWSERVVRYWPGSDMLTRHAVFLALDGKTREARDLLVKTVRAFPGRCQEINAILNRALAADMHAIGPLQNAVGIQPACNPVSGESVRNELKRP